MLRPDGRIVRHRFEILRQIWWLFPCLGSLCLLYYPIWPGIWGYPVAIVMAVFFVCGFYLSFLSMRYVPHVYVLQLILGMSFIWFIVGGTLSATVVLAFKVPAMMGTAVAIGAALMLVTASALGAMRATQRDWGERQRWLRSNANRKWFRAWDAEPDGARLDTRSTAAIAISLMGLINIVGYLWLGDAQAFRTLLMPSLAVAMSVVAVRGVYILWGSTLATVIQLRRIEKAEGHRFILGNIEELHRERRAHWLGRFVVPRTLKLDPIHRQQHV